MEDKKIEEIESYYETLDPQMFCKSYFKLLVVSFKNLERKNIIAVLKHVHNCDHRWCKTLVSFSNEIIPIRDFDQMLDNNISYLEEEKTEALK